ncbi:serine/threonine-protein kinase HipA [Povalibacter uvarum]|uniref:Serine/threonine-protein kinase HipA n=1 Tax=Povalibacter uvarum TaxID=732238 RepID=A0A841HRM7_9GAMM|nr:type II toxin-antitoxin system HipA family toxin [Povalibacter uvarum]MBB6095304.1 serine/threonine-protein kinase HipA [Povalibacter uvarum]
MAYSPGEQLHLWLLTLPQEPVLVGELRLMRSNQGVSLRYADTWIENGFPLSEDLPLITQEFLPTDKGTAAGAIDDARPDRWGEQVIRFIDKPPRLSLLEFLYFAGEDRFGALGVSTSATEYVPRTLGPLPTLREADEIHELVQKVLANEPIPQARKRLISPGVTLGGARPKALIDIDGEQWVIKFSPGDPADTPLIEHASMTLAAKARIHVARTMPVRLADGHAVAIKRFDRSGKRRLHCLSAHVALRAAAERFGYPELAQLLRRRGVIEKDRYLADMRELFRRMVFNILIDNTDDHEKNHALVMSDAQQYQLSPAYDVLPSGQALGFQQMRVGEQEADSTIENALSMSRLFSLTPDQAVKEIRTVARVVDGWQAHFRSEGVSKRDIELYAEQIDREFLRGQRDEHVT